MNAIKCQYFLSFAVVGCVLPYLSPFLRHRGLDDAQIGYTIGFASALLMLTPVCVTLLADTILAGRRLLAVVFVLTGGFLAALWPAQGFWPLLMLIGGFELCFAPAMPVQDGMNFTIQKRRREAGLPVQPYHHVRVWGTIGFMAPSVMLFVLFRGGLPIESILPAGMACCLLGVICSFALPDTRARRGGEPEKPGGRQSLPTFAAARTICRPPVLVYCVAMLLIHMAVALFYSFFPLYLTELIGIDKQWVGLIVCVGVGIELVFILGFGVLRSRLGLKALVLLGIASTVLRISLLAAVPTLATALITQALHGPLVLMLYVTPPMYLNRHAGDRFRSSIQGLYVMAVAGGGRVIGNVAGGIIVDRFGLITAFACAATLCVPAGLLVLMAFEDRAPLSTSDPAGGGETFLEY